MKNTYEITRAYVENKWWWRVTINGHFAGEYKYRHEARNHVRSARALNNDPAPNAKKSGSHVPA